MIENFSRNIFVVSTCFQFSPSSFRLFPIWRDQPYGLPASPDPDIGVSPSSSPAGPFAAGIRLFVVVVNLEQVQFGGGTGGLDDRLCRGKPTPGPMVATTVRRRKSKLRGERAKVLFFSLRKERPKAGVIERFAPRGKTCLFDLFWSVFESSRIALSKYGERNFRFPLFRIEWAICGRVIGHPVFPRPVYVLYTYLRSTYQG